MLHKEVKSLDFSTLLPDVVTIADEVDAQLKQQMLRFMAADAAKAKSNWYHEANESPYSALPPFLRPSCFSRQRPDRTRSPQLQRILWPLA